VAATTPRAFKHLRQNESMKFGARANGNILICGAGIAGHALAFWLSRYGFNPTLIERAPHLRDGGYMVDVWGIGYDILERSDLMSEVREHSYPIDRLIFVDGSGREIARFGGELIRKIFADRFFCIPRGDLARTFYNALGTQTETLYNTSIDLLYDTPDGACVTLSGDRFRRFDIVVGADGLHSQVRKWAFGTEDQFQKYLGYYAASFTSENYPYRNEVAYMTFARPGRQISRYTLRNNRSAFLLVFAEPRPLGIDQRSLVAQKNFLRNRFKGGAWETDAVLASLDSAEELFFDAVSQIRMQKWCRGRVALIGDAAYCPSLLAGEGAAFAMLGAYILAGELHKADGDYQQAFAAYEIRLQNFIRRKQDAATGFAKSFAPKTELGLCVRTIAIKLLNSPAIGVGLTRRMFGSAFSLPEYRDVGTS
jgi:2-polyprenyl-6-methoxyphenol hydroxylase-like FAD-dependent oxidoreductase